MHPNLGGGDGAEIDYMASAARDRGFTAVAGEKPRVRLLSIGSGLLMVLAVIAAFAGMELVVRSVASGYPRRPLPLASFTPDRIPTGDISDNRECAEGWAITHSWRDGSRVTGNPWLQPASVGVIVGDSFSESYQVSDNAIVASRVEHMARQEGKALNVRQYGWSGASVPVYVAIAPNLLNTLTPAWVTVLLNISDLGVSGLTDSLYWQGRIDSRGELILKEISETKRLAEHSAGWRATRAVMERSILAFYLFNKLKEIIDPRPVDIQGSSVRTRADRFATFAEVRTLKHAYGSRLLIVYTPRVYVSRESDNVIEEQGLLDACYAERVRCVSMRPAMIQARDLQHKMCTGFANTLPGDGHLNAYGHEVLAQLIWSNVRDLAGQQ